MASSSPDSTMEPVALAAEADHAVRSDWERAAAAVLRKAKRLVADDPDSLVWDRLSQASLAGMTVLPIYSADSVVGLPGTGEPGVAPFTRGRQAGRPESGWDVRVEVAGDASAANQTILDELEHGASSLWLRLGPDVQPEHLDRLLAGVLVDLAPIVLDSPDDPVSAARSLVSWLEGKGLRAAPGSNLGADPLGGLLRGRSSLQVEDLSDTVAEVARLALAAGTLALVVDATAVHDLGGAEDLELGFALAAGAAYLRLLVATGLSAEQAFGMVEFRFAATDDQFLTIAKLRAARRTWSRVGELSGVPDPSRGQRQHAVTSRPMMSKYDPWVNMLRTTVAAFAAGVGGADAVTVVPFDDPLGEPDDLGRRVARNTSAVLVSESHVAIVTDPAGGSYAVEALTEALAERAWSRFGELENLGGAVEAITSGALAGLIEECRAARSTRVATRRQPITGLSEFPNLGEVLPQRTPHPGGTHEVERYGAGFEALRDTPAARPVFLATMGSLAEHTARAMFATNLLAAGGVSVEVAGPTSTVAEVLAAYGTDPHPSPVVCLAGPDSAYAAWGAELVAELRRAGARHVILAGKPGERTVAPDLLDDACAKGADALAFLGRTRTALEEAQ